MATALLCGALCATSTYAQAAVPPPGRHIVIIGSSTAAGYGATHPDSSWVGHYARYLKKIDSSWKVTNLAVGGYTTYHVLPSRRTNPKDRPRVDSLRNLTSALALHPSAVIISLPSNDIALGYSWEEQYANWAHIRAELVAADIPFWVATSQPNSKYPELIPSLAAFRDWLLSSFPTTIDFWTNIAAADGKIRPNFNYDNVHPNNAGHRVLFQQVVNIGIPEYLDTATRLKLPAPPNLWTANTAFKAGKSEAHLQWQESAEIDSSYYRAQLSLDSLFTQVLLDTITRYPSLRYSNALRGTPYFWRVQAYNTRKASSWSIRSFFLAPTLQAPKPASPPDNSLDISLNTQISWRAPFYAGDSSPAAKRSDATTPVTNEDQLQSSDSTYKLPEFFHLQVSRDSTFKDVEVSLSALADTVAVVGPLDAGVTYFWRVRTESSLDTTEFSPKFRFTTMQPVTSIHAKNPYQQPLAFSSGQIRIHLAKRTKVTLYLVDSRGTKTPLISARSFLAGTHSIPVSMPKTTGRYQLVMQNERTRIAIPVNL